MAFSNDEPWTWFVALDGGELNGLIGSAGLMRFDWPERRLTHRFYEGVSSGHNVTLSPDGQRLLLGNFSQQFVLIDTETLEVIARATTMKLEPADYPLRSNTHHLWYDNETFIGAVGENLYRFRAEPLGEVVERWGPHRLWNAHELRWTADHRYILMGDLGPEDTGARQVGVFDTVNRQAEIIRLPGTVWHTVVHPQRPVGYAATYTFIPDQEDYVRWSPAYAREYIFEIDLPTARVMRTWSSGAAFPIHLNSDLELYDGDGESKLYVASGGSHTVVELELETLTKTRVVEVVPSWWNRLTQFRQRRYNTSSAFLRASAFTNSHMLVNTYFVTNGRAFDGVYAARVSPDGEYLVAGNRGYNYMRVMRRRTLETVYERQLPKLQRRVPHQDGKHQRRYESSGLHLGMHHSEIKDRRH